jgi:hypothetical protein
MSFDCGHVSAARNRGSAMHVQHLSRNKRAVRGCQQCGRYRNFLRSSEAGERRPFASSVITNIVNEGSLPRL